MTISRSARNVLSIFKKDIESRPAEVKERALRITSLLYTKPVPAELLKTEVNELKADYDAGKELTFEETYLLANIYYYEIFIEPNPELAFYLYDSIAKKGYIHAIREIACYYSIGEIVKQDKEKAVSMYQPLAMQNHPIAQAELAICYRDGEGIPKDEKEAVRLFTLSAENGYVSAQHCLGLCYLNGTGVSIDEEKGFFWIKKAMQQAPYASTEAIFCLGLQYGRGGLSKDEGAANELIARAINDHDSAFLIELALIHKEGKFSSPVDPKKAFILMEHAANQGNANALAWLGAFHSDGFGTHVNAEAAALYYREASQRGDTDADYLLGLCYRNGNGVTMDLKRAFEYFQKGAEHKNRRCFFEMGKAYIYCDGTKRDIKKAIECLEQALEYGIQEAKCFLAVCYADRNFGIDKAKGLQLLNQFIAENDPNAMFELANIYYSTPNLELGLQRKMIELLERAVSLNLDIAKIRLADCYQKGFGVQRSLSKAFDMYKELENRNINALNRLADLYADDRKEDIVISRDYKLSKQYYLRAAEKGHYLSKLVLARIYNQALMDCTRNPKLALYWYEQCLDFFCYDSEVLLETAELYCDPEDKHYPDKVFEPYKALPLYETAAGLLETKANKDADERKRPSDEDKKTLEQIQQTYAKIKYLKDFSLFEQTGSDTMVKVAPGFSPALFKIIGRYACEIGRVGQENNLRM